MNNIGAFLKSSRQKKGYSQIKLADLVGTSSSYISMLENGKREPSVYFLDLLLEKLEENLSLPFNKDDYINNNSFLYDFKENFPELCNNGIIATSYIMPVEEAISINLKAYDFFKLKSILEPLAFTCLNLSLLHIENKEKYSAKTYINESQNHFSRLKVNKIDEVILYIKDKIT